MALVSQVKLRAGGGRRAVVLLSELVTQLPQGKPVESLTQEQRFVMVLTDCDSLLLTAVYRHKNKLRW